MASSGTNENMDMSTSTQQMILDQLQKQGEDIREMKTSLRQLVQIEERQAADRLRIRALESENKEQLNRITALEIAAAQQSGHDGVLWPIIEKSMMVLVLMGVMYIAATGKVQADEFYARAGLGVHPDLTANLPDGWGASDYNDRIIAHFSLGWRDNIGDKLSTYVEAEHVSDPAWADPGAGLNWIKAGIERTW